jgi:hypothetical protein
MAGALIREVSRTPEHQQLILGDSGRLVRIVN